ncbi:MAG: hypothetical protein QT00_C0002G0389 [archaeon GW2011_AR5]|nr:MAG: hypothetical protein QT00_C0002G0389 [archaeon GW2011_AR5]
MIIIEKKRIHSVKTRIKDITGGRYVAQEGFNPNYVLTKYGLRLSRVRILATVVDKFISEGGKFASVTLDDGTDTIRVKVFNAVSMYDNIGVGSEVDVIARVKEYQGEIYLAPEIINVADDSNMQLLRELELRQQDREVEGKRKIILEHQKQTSDMSELERLMHERYGIQPEEVESMLQVHEEPQDNRKEEVLKLVEKLDDGNGCDYADLIKASGLPEDVIDSMVNELLEEGSCFEPKPGKIKKL